MPWKAKVIVNPLPAKQIWRLVDLTLTGKEASATQQRFQVYRERRAESHSRLNLSSKVFSSLRDLPNLMVIGIDPILPLCEGGRPTREKVTTVCQHHVPRAKSKE